MHTECNGEESKATLNRGLGKDEAYCHWSIVRTRPISGFIALLPKGEMWYLACYCFSTYRTLLLCRSDNNTCLPKWGYVMWKMPNGVRIVEGAK